MKIEIKNQTYSSERALYMLNDAEVGDCRFEGIEDGESPLKESNNISVNNCYFALRYALWHVSNSFINSTEFEKTCRAPLWYCEHLKISNLSSLAPKALRESNDIVINNSHIVSEEFGWKCANLTIVHSYIESSYLFFMCKDIKIDTLNMKGKYSFQYVENMIITNSNLDTKDAFWHSKNVTVYDSIIKGEYIAWYAENITFVNCKISGTQPFCYTRGVKLVNCELLDADLAFEYSDVDAVIKSEMISIKNPCSGKIIVKGVKKIINTNSKYPNKCEIIINRDL